MCLALVVSAACASHPPEPTAAPARASAVDPVGEDAAAPLVVVSIVGTNDWHGALARLPILAGYVANLREARRGDGAVLLVDAGDMFQGTLESNLNEGAAMVAAYNAMGYAAAALGNHEFDFGPVGPAATPRADGHGPERDPRGALRARLAEARFPMLAANLVDAAVGARVSWPNAPAAVMVNAAGVDVGIVGVLTEDTPHATMPANFVGLAISPLAAAIEREARDLREHGAAVIVVSAHAGGRCQDLDDPADLSSCAPDEEIMAVAEALPPGLVDVIVAGHTHQAMAQRVNGIAIIESYARGRAFGRVDLVVDVEAGEVRETHIFAPRDLCPGDPAAAVAACAPGRYEGRPVEADPALAAVIADALAAARAQREAPLGVDIGAPVTRSYSHESALGNLFADLMRVARPADVAITNGGGLRADLAPGPLTYGALYEAMPFDNRFARVRLSGATLERLIAINLGATNGIWSLSGLRARVRCDGDTLEVSLARADGTQVADDEMITLVTSDFLATGGDPGFDRLREELAGVDVELDGETIRDAVAAVLRSRGGALTGADPALFDANARRLLYPGERPVTCP
ncbi:bifunctional metallophosphatase/5'-nucleotidase [Haliangium sp.]|uniref:bifunctional metallophosphatase/5'-nucleotidase n=1 Tax=Haliangium sp. TaxID=2663208 RepID=UPI003D110088